jgi:hypothetical protein
MAVSLWSGRPVWPKVDEIQWMKPAELVREGYQRSRVVMLNEARSGEKRCERTRRVGVRIMPMARACAATLLAMETWGTSVQATKVLLQPDMMALVDEARLQGFRLAGYDIDEAKTPIKLRTKVKSPGYTNWRDAQQAANLAGLFSELPADEKMLVWATNLHHATARFMMYRPMGWRFTERTKVAPFSIDQTVTVDWTGHGGRSPTLKWAGDKLMEMGGHAGYIWQEGLPRLSPGCDAFILSLENQMS